MNRKSIFDVIIIGGGVSGLISALACDKIGIKVALVEKKELKAIDNNDIRSLAIAPSSADFLAGLGVWQKIADRVGKIKNIRVLDNYSPFFLDFGERESPTAEVIGYIIEGYKLHKQLIEDVGASPTIEVFDGDEIISYEDLSTEITQIKLASGRVLSSRLVIGADGKFSKVRELLGIKSYDFDYKQTVMVAFCQHKKKHKNWAIEHFMPSGPFAILPLADPHKSGIVWTEKPELVALYCKMKKDEFNYFLNQKFTDYLGNVKLEGEVRSYPLSLKFSKQYYSGRFVLVGDAVHTIHPLAGQGLNLGIRDIRLLMELIARNFSVGLDIGSQVLLAEYQRTRLLDNSLMLLATHGLDTLFSNDYTLLKPIRKLGLSLVNRMDKLKKLFMVKAMGKNYKDIK